MKYHLISLGCQMNMSDSERVRTVVEEMGYVWTDDESEASLVGILACSVRQKAIDKVYSRIAQWNKRKNKQNLLTFLSGCILPSDKEKFLKLFDIVFPMSELKEFPDMVNQYGVVTPSSLRMMGNELVLNQHIKDFWNINPKYNSSFEAFVPIQNGCDKFCTYCAVPYTRGREVSRPSQEIIQEVKNLVEKDYKSITLLGQNVNSYGLDKNGEEVTFSELLKMIGEYGKTTDREFWVYFTSPHPRDMTPDVIDVIAEYICLGKQIHLPIQSGDDKVLIRMNRKHSVENYRKIIHKIWDTLPQATIFTDIIVGFTGETEEQFTNTCEIMDEFKYNMAYIAMYSPRPGATSSRWADDVDHDIKKERFHRLSEKLKIHTKVYNDKMIGQTFRVLVTGKDRKEDYLSGLTEGKIVLRFACADEKLIGQIVDVKIHSAATFSVEGELIKIEEPKLS
jgi:tRNA-2-methylthio-N6-dimethylallyladenosine synthase